MAESAWEEHFNKITPGWKELLETSGNDVRIDHRILSRVDLNSNKHLSSLNKIVLSVAGYRAGIDEQIMIDNLIYDLDKLDTTGESFKQQIDSTGEKANKPDSNFADRIKYMDFIWQQIAARESRIMYVRVLSKSDYPTNLEKGGKLLIDYLDKYRDKNVPMEQGERQEIFDLAVSLKVNENQNFIEAFSLNGGDIDKVEPKKGKPNVKEQVDSLLAKTDFSIPEAYADLRESLRNLDQIAIYYLDEISQSHPDPDFRDNLIDLVNDLAGRNPKYVQRLWANSLETKMPGWNSLLYHSGYAMDKDYLASVLTPKILERAPGDLFMPNLEYVDIKFKSGIPPNKERQKQMEEFIMQMDDLRANASEFYEKLDEVAQKARLPNSPLHARAEYLRMLWMKDAMINARFYYARALAHSKEWADYREKGPKVLIDFINQRELDLKPVPNKREKDIIDTARKLHLLFDDRFTDAFIRHGGSASMLKSAREDQAKQEESLQKG